MNHTITKYPDNFAYIQVDDPFKQHTVFRINSYEDLMHLKLLCDSYKYAETGSVIPNIIIPCFPSAQDDDRFEDRGSFGLKVILEVLGTCDASFEVFHPHNSPMVKMGLELLDKRVKIIDNTDYIMNVMFSLGMFESPEQWVVLLPDAGAFKWGVKLMDRLGWTGDLENASKSRKWNGDKSVLTQKLPPYDFTSKKILIIDDLSIYGGTFKRLSKLLQSQGASKENLYLAVSHITVQDHGASDPVFNYFNKVFTTNSKYDNYYISDNRGSKISPDNLEVVKMFTL